MKNIYNLVDDIYKVVSTKEVDEGVDIDAAIEQFGENVKNLMRQEFGEQKKRDNRTLRMSNIGREDRYLWNVCNGVEANEEIQGHTYVKFLYGHLIEELLLFLTRAAGHEVTGEQNVSLGQPVLNCNQLILPFLCLSDGFFQQGCTTFGLFFQLRPSLD